MKKEEIEYPMVVMLEAVLMGNGEVIHFGKSLGFAGKKQMELVESGATKIARGNEPVVAIRTHGRDNVA